MSFIPAIDSRLAFLRRRLGATAGLLEGLPGEPQHVRYARIRGSLVSTWILLRMRDQLLPMNCARFFGYLVRELLPLLPEEMKQQLTQEWKAYKAQRA